MLLRNTPHNISSKELEALAGKAHGYVGADLGAVVREGGTRAIKRWAAASSITTSIDSSSTPGGTHGDQVESNENGTVEGKLVLTLEDLEAALPLVRPSAMRSLFVDSPPVRWGEIGGQAGTSLPQIRQKLNTNICCAEVIQKLREAVEWPLLHPEAFKRLGARPPKGQFGSSLPLKRHSDEICDR